MNLPSHVGRILVVDDDESFGELLKNILEHSGFHTHFVTNLKQMEEKLKALSFDFVLLDLHLGEENGLDGLAMVLKQSPFARVYIVTAAGTVERAVHAMQRGACGFFEKTERVGETIVAELSAAQTTIASHSEASPFQGLIGNSKALGEVIDKIDRLKTVDSAVLILGESGTGKEVVARAIHASSPRFTQRFDAINCGAIPENLLESELFGHRRGAFTDAKSDRKGIFELCSAGTLLLDEIGDMPLSLQMKLLRVLQEHEITPVGASQSIKINTRVIAATHRDILAESRAKRFREDLYFRLSIVVIRIPALRERIEDIPLLVAHFLDVYNQRFSREVRPPQLSLMRRICEYPWPGNIRELQHAVERAVVLSRDGNIDERDLFAHISAATDNSIHSEQVTSLETFIPQQCFDLPLTEAKNAFEESYLKYHLQRCNGQIVQMAAVCGRYRADIYRLLARHGINHRSL